MRFLVIAAAFMFSSSYAMAACTEQEFESKVEDYQKIAIEAGSKNPASTGKYMDMLREAMEELSAKQDEITGKEDADDDAAEQEALDMSCSFIDQKIEELKAAAK